MPDSQTPATPDSSDPEYLTAAEVATRIRKKPEWVRAHANGHRHPVLPSVKAGKERVFRRQAVDDFMLHLERETAAQIERRRRR